MRNLRSLLVAICLAVLVFPAYCQANTKHKNLKNMFADILSSAPNRFTRINFKDDLSPNKLKQARIDHQYRLTTEPGISLQFWVIEPRNIKGEILSKPRGTIFMLHGVFTTKGYMKPWSRMFTSTGYRVVLVDSRGHGRSTGTRLTYGVKESEDLTKILNFLETKNLITAPVGVFGHSYGAATAIQWAGKEKRIKAVAVISPFSELRTVAMNYIKLFAPYLIKSFTKQQLQEIVTASANKAGFNVNDANPMKKIAYAKQARFALLHGRKDKNIPPAHSRLIKKSADKSGVKCDVYELPTATHDRFDSVARKEIIRRSLEVFNDMPQPETIKNSSIGKP